MVLLALVGFSTATPPADGGPPTLIANLFPDRPLAVGAHAHASFAYICTKQPCSEIEDGEVSVDDPAIARATKDSVEGLAAGRTTVRFTATIDGVRTTVAHPLDVRAPARREWRYRDDPITGDVVTPVGSWVSVSAVFLDAGGVHLASNGLPLEVPAGWTRMDVEDAGMYLDTKQPGRFPLPDSPWAIVVVAQ